MTASTLGFVLVGLVHLLPVAGLASADRLQALYGVPAPDPATLLLLRHRAVLFGVLGALLVSAPFVPGLATPAALAGLASMLGYVALAAPVRDRPAPLTRVLWVDLVCLPVLAAAWLVG